MILAIDPGASGGIAAQFQSGKIISIPMPETETDVKAEIDAIEIFCKDEERRAVVEKVGGFTGQGQPGSAMFGFGYGVGVIMGLLIEKRYRIERPTPQKWQKVLGLGTRDKSAPKTVWKNKLKAKAQELFPDQKVTLKTADALLILEAAKRTAF